MTYKFCDYPLTINYTGLLEIINLFVKIWNFFLHRQKFQILVPPNNSHLEMYEGWHVVHVVT